MDIRKLRALIDLVQESGIAELEITEGEEKVRIARTLPAGATVVPQQVMLPPSAPPQAPAAAVVVEEPPAKRETPPETRGHVVRAPMVGTFYRSPSPEAPPFVNVGDKVKANQTLCIIEAMKMLNQIEADVAGVVSEIVAQNEQAVQFDQPLFVIEPA